MKLIEGIKRWGMEDLLWKQEAGEGGMEYVMMKIPLCHYMWMEQKTKDKRDIEEYNFYFLYVLFIKPLEIQDA